MIVIPMAGMSSRFFKAGYTQPKYMLEAHGKTLFEHSVESFKSYYKSKRFLFIVRDVFNTVDFVKKTAESLGISDFKIIVLNQETRGQAETVTLGLSEITYQGPITIFNIDTFRPNFKYPNLNKLGDGYLEVFQGEGDNWSFVKPLNELSHKVTQTTEKNPISDLCCTGLYYFSSVNDYLDAYNDYLAKPENEWEKAELYVAPLYNHLISEGKNIHYNLIKRRDVIFCGVPDEYIYFLER
ncbi:dTDP-glucose pyrophosphorylase [Marinomonas ushuaiensis DSM 15871]|uniref:dTDP-glucose pyrophosphorylase n=1 Tax=Marinomonas ushuaiensis DSM 15871 TaxID=1122207 RepID=X7E9P3_9GAMM|nr:glycosyltransferase family 2 protein [Marinomonas ushuaiensis]ETX12580.1 dTDP-glucose pyrophosphorylase [Marinomonas ushuaiensis DSM 15871]